VEGYLKAAGVTDEDLDEREEKNGYWNSAITFVRENFKRELSSLSHKQASWISKIADDITEEKLKEDERGIR